MDLLLNGDDVILQQLAYRIARGLDLTRVSSSPAELLQSADCAIEVQLRECARTTKNIDTTAIDTFGITTKN